MAGTLKRIVILGAGFGGAWCARALERKLRGRDADVLLVDRNDYLVFYPLLVEAGTGSLEPRHAVVSVRSFLRSTRFLMAEVLRVDVARREVRVRAAESSEDTTLPYDHLVLALGSVTRLPSVPGLAEHGFELKGMGDAVTLRDRAVRMLEAAEAATDAERRRALLSFTIVGANFTGVELAGEFHAFLHEARKRHSALRSSDCQVTLVELGDRILPALDPELSEFATRELTRRGISVRLGTSVSRIEDDRVTLSDDTELPSCTTIWCAGIAPNPVLETVDLPRDERGYLECEANLRVKGQECVWAIGDCANNPAPAGQPYPATAQHAVQQGSHLAANIARALVGDEPRRFAKGFVGTLAALGCRTGVAKVFGVKLAGFPAWWLWRTVYLLKMPGLARKVRVALDWTLDLLFPREHVQLGVHEAGKRRPR